VDIANVCPASYILTVLELAFDTKSLRDLCEKEEKARRELAPDVAQKLKHRLADLRAADSVEDLVAGRPRETESANPGYFVIDLTDGSRLAFCANHRNVPLLTSGGVDWSRVSRIKILRIENAHGQQRLRA
jgi:proteic killer suppression protein